VSDGNAVRAQKWQPGFRHSAGKLGSHFIRAIRNGQLFGWKTKRLGVTIPPIETGEPGEWVEVGPVATLVGYASPNDLAPGDIEPGKVFAALKVDGADTLLYALVACDDAKILFPGMRLKAILPHDTEAGTLPTFQPEAAA